MPPNNHHERLLLRLAQFQLLNRDKNAIDNKDVESVLQELDLSMQIPGTSFLMEYDDDKIIGASPLHVAFLKSNLDLLNLLIRKGADFNIKDKEGNTVVHKAFRDLCFFHCLIKEKVDSFNVSEKFIASILAAHVTNSNTDNPIDPNGVSHFHVACATNDMKAVEFFLNNGESVNQAVVYICSRYGSKKIFEGYKPLHFAVEFGCVEVIEILLKHGANTNEADEKGQTPQLLAVKKNIKLRDSVEKACLLSRDVDANEQIIDLLLNHSTCSKFSNLLVASAMKDPRKAEHFLAQGIDVNQSMSVNSQVWPGYTALHFAAHVNVDTVKLLVKNGANIEAKDANGVTPLEMCIDRYSIEDLIEIIQLVPTWNDIVLTDGTTKLVEVLFAFKSSENMSSFLQKSKDNVKLFVPLDSPLWLGSTVLHIGVLLSERKKCKTDYKYENDAGVFEPDLTIIAECLKQNADVTIKDHRGCTPVHLAFRLEKEMTLAVLLHYHHRIQNSADEKNLSHLHIACAKENKKLVKKLLWNDADVNIAYQGASPISDVYPGWTPLHIAVHKSNYEIVELLIQFDADIYAADVHGFTPVHRLMMGYKDSRKLGQAVFNAPNLRDHVVEDMGLSYLHVACRVNAIDAVKQLLDLGADVNKAISSAKISDIENYPSIFDYEDYDGSTPLHWALVRNETERVELLSLLIERGADVLAKKANNLTPLYGMLQYGYHDFIDALVEVFQRNADLQKRVEMETGVTLLHLAASIVRVDLVEELLDDGADVNARIHENSFVWSRCTPLHVLLSDDVDLTVDEWKNMNRVIETLLNHNADVTLVNDKKDTPLHAIYREICFDKDASGFGTVILMLKAHKNFDVNPTSIEGFSHFHIACHMLEVDVVENFLKHGVDVNFKVDVFYDSQFAAVTPLHLAVKSTRDLSLDDPKNPFLKFARLKIVDLLIKNGADVNAEDVFANTPAHYTATCDWSKKSLFRRLAESGADVNKRNLQGEAPLEKLLKQDHFTGEELGRFIMSGCRFNAFNKVTEKGYIALADSVIAHADMLHFLFEAFIVFPDSVKVDDRKRTALHNVVSINAARTTRAQFIELIDVFTMYGCDIDDQDDLGRTALHLAAQFRNETAVAGLLLSGADINMTDCSGKTPFAYVFEPCRRCSNVKDPDHDQYSHPILFKTFMVQMKNMEFCDIYVSPSNGVLLDKALKKFGSDNLAENDLNGILEEVEQIGNMKIDPYPLSAADFVSAAVAVVDYPMMSLVKRKVIDAFFRANKLTFQTNFKLAAGILIFQYRQALLRRKIIGTAVESLRVLAKCQLPDICSHIILRSLKNFELENLIASTVENYVASNMDVDVDC